MYPRIFSACFICLFIAACDGQEVTSVTNITTEVISKSTEVKTTPEQAPEQKPEQKYEKKPDKKPDKKSEQAPEQMTERATQQKTRPALNLSIDTISLDHQEKDGDIFNSDKAPAETQSELFKTLNRDQKESDINVSGKLLTDEEKIDNKQYLDSIEGLQINIEGNFM